MCTPSHTFSCWFLLAPIWIRRRHPDPAGWVTHWAGRPRRTFPRRRPLRCTIAACFRRSLPPHWLRSVFILSVSPSLCVSAPTADYMNNLGCVNPQQLLSLSLVWTPSPFSRFSRSGELREGFSPDLVTSPCPSAFLFLCLGLSFVWLPVSSRSLRLSNYGCGSVFPWFSVTGRMAFLYWNDGNFCHSYFCICVCVRFTVCSRALLNNQKQFFGLYNWRDKTL